MSVRTNCSINPVKRMRPDVRFGSKADIAERDWHVRLVPNADIAITYTSESDKL